MKSLPVSNMKKYFIFTGVIIIIALVFYLGVKSEKIIETVLSSGGIVGILAFIFNRKRTGSGNNGRGNSRDPGISISELERIRNRYRDVNRRLEEGLGKSRSEVGQLRDGLKRDRERIGGLEGTGAGIRIVANELDDLIKRIQEEGIDKDFIQWTLIGLLSAYIAKDAWDNSFG